MEVDVVGCWEDDGLTAERDPRASILSVNVARMLFTLEVLCAGFATGMVGVAIARWDLIGAPALISAAVALLLAVGMEWVRRRIPR